MSFEASQVVDGQKIGMAVGWRGIEPNRPTLILIHGSGGSRHSWPDQIEAVKQVTAEQLEPNRPETIINNLRACDRFDRRQDLGRIDRPVLIVCGRQDKMTPTALSDFMGENISRAKRTYIDRGSQEIRLGIEEITSTRLSVFDSSTFRLCVSYVEAA